MIRLTTPLIPFANRASRTTARDDVQLERHFDTLATRLVGDRATSAGHHYAIGITSCLPAEGVSTIARNLAITFAQLRSQPTLLIDASGGDAELNEVFGVRGPSTPEAQNEGLLRDRICKTNVDNLSVVTAGESTVPLSCIDSDQLRQLVSGLKQDFDLILADLPPAGELSGGIAWASAVDGVVLVVEPESVSAIDANRAKVHLQHAGASLLGVVINKDK